ncbi:MAG: FliM/FliN family flagellar motor switch protein [Myxococcota bacterium]|nr:FliM/FliN family flagellar motor switch protein [Myxococcota bacterium]
MTSDAESRDRNSWEFLDDIPVEVVIELGRKRMVIRELAGIDVDDVIELNQAVDRPLDIVVGGKVVARGELVIVGERMAVRISELSGRVDEETE